MIRLINLHHLRIFYTVATSESFSRAAEKLDVSQPAVSMQVRKLEEALGVSLVQQVGRQLYLTEGGQILSEYAARIFNLVREAEDALAEVQGLRRGHVTVAASSTPGAYVLPPLIARFRQIHPGIDIDLQISNSHIVLERLQRGEVDFGVIGEVPGRSGDQALEFDLLVPDDLVVIVPPGHRFALEGVAGAAALAGEPLVLREPGSSQRQVLEARLRELGLQATVALQLGTTDAIKHAVAAGLGVGVLSCFSVTWEVAAGHLAAVAVPELDLHRNLYIARHRDRRLTRAASALVQLFRTEAQPCRPFKTGA